MSLTELVDKAINKIQKGKGYLDHGNDGTIYAITDEVVLKLHTGSYRGSPQKSAEYEFSFGTELYQHGVQVPQYLGLFGPVPLHHREGCGIFMERIHGLDPSSLQFPGLLEARRQYLEQKKKIEELGYVVKDSKNVYSNTLFDPKQNKLFLFDLVRWERK